MIRSLPAGTIKRIHVNRHVIARNRRTGESAPALTIQTSKGPQRAGGININGPSWMVYRPERPLSCGAVAWVETRAEVSYWR